MTPAIKLLTAEKIAFQIHEYKHDPKHASYGLEAAEKLGLDASQVYKTLVVTVDGKQLVVAIIPVASQLSMKAVAKAMKGKKAEMADKVKVQRSTGYVLGGVSPLGQKARLPSFVDESASTKQSIFVSAGRRGLEIELAPSDLVNLLDGRFVSLTQ